MDHNQYPYATPTERALYHIVDLLEGIDRRLATIEAVVQPANDLSTSGPHINTREILPR